ncbi:hypothetical protein SKAU_G00280250 [Synaphobranchus kaupii]|uniref:Resolvase HTH domain-containing protein n=1 Tax=Synaphobranchus kaupii TaxID=118154 RepID=A0A9Q1EWW5_SYNKA|nr:hypothetical protein SKAU_G00280250 [Synaphobranchus kaupii]
MEDTLRRIQRRCLAVRQACRQGSAGDREYRSLTLSILNVRRIEASLSREVADELLQSLDELRRAIATSSDRAQTSVSFSAPRVSRRGSRGRPSLNITREQLQMLMQQGFSIRQMARVLNCSSSYLYRRTRSLGISMRSRFSSITDDEFEQQIQRLHQLYPRAGSEQHSVGVTLLPGEPTMFRFPTVYGTLMDICASYVGVS